MSDGLCARVSRAHTITLRVDHSARWTYSEQHADAMDAHWQAAVQRNPAFFNGTVHALTELSWSGDDVTGTLMPIPFKAMLYWREAGFPVEAGIRDGFGSALIRSREGHVVLGRQRPGNLNAGLAYLPGGFIDPRDEMAPGMIDIAASVAREVVEETGLGPDVLTREPGFLVTETGPYVSFSGVFTSQLSSHDLAARVRAHIAGETDPELAEPVVLQSPDDLAHEAIAAYARVLLASPLAWR